ncbi:hypothetical protein CTAYLR_008489 [Chrysophaeum taylorii]|uniref:Fe2OG dioxygenase domain-containing protein n=1 Tax=Chrysophaeum taylorii TaxID=2483200 RepID=A0AAD7XIZ0_9STRA|nr:hypothetical protein CTAYLR_008489 [Chrysophaeum taylorii]
MLCARKLCLASLRRGLVEDGFVCVRSESIGDAYSVLKAAHALPLAVKERFSGYGGSDAGKPEPAYDGGSTASARSWDFSRHALALGGKPATPLDLDDLFDRQDALGESIAVGIAEAFGLPPRYLADLIRSSERGGFGIMRLMAYPAGADVGIAPHTDFECFTVMHQDAPGLELMRRDGTWVSAPLLGDDGFIVIVGDVLERLTNGHLKATPHRVVECDRDRHSIIRFHALRPDAIVAPLPHFGEPVYTPVSMAKHMRTTLTNLKLGKPAWDPVSNASLTATYVYDSPR